MARITSYNAVANAPSTAVLAIDDGSETYKITNANLTGMVVLTASSLSSLPKTVSDSRITADMVVVNSVLSNPSAQTGDWTVTTANGSLTIAGNISGGTNFTLYLAHGK